MKLWKVLAAVSAMGLAPAISVEAATFVNFNSQSGSGFATYTESGATLASAGGGTFEFALTPNGTVGRRSCCRRRSRRVAVSRKP